MRRAVVLEERLRIARDLHDVVGHGMGAITVQAGTGYAPLSGLADVQDRSLAEAAHGVDVVTVREPLAEVLRGVDLM